MKKIALVLLAAMIAVGFASCSMGGNAPSSEGGKA